MVANPKFLSIDEATAITRRAEKTKGNRLVQHLRQLSNGRIHGHRAALLSLFIEINECRVDVRSSKAALILEVALHFDNRETLPGKIEQACNDCDSTSGASHLISRHAQTRCGYTSHDWSMRRIRKCVASPIC